MNHPQSQRRRLLCRNRATGQFLFIVKTAPHPGDLVAIRTATGIRVEAYNGQHCLGVVVPANDLAISLIHG